MQKIIVILTLLLPCLSSLPGIGQNGTLSGTIRLYDTQAMPGVQVYLLDQSAIRLDSTRTNANGQFQFNGLTAGQTYELRPHWSEAGLDGLSTLDIVLGFQALVGSRPFDNPVSELAGDLDGSNHFSIRDLVLMRRLILGQDQPSTAQFWRFLPAGLELESANDVFQVWPTGQKIFVTPQSENFVFNIQVYKAGDISQNAGGR